MIRYKVAGDSRELGAGSTEKGGKPCRPALSSGSRFKIQVVYAWVLYRCSRQDSILNSRKPAIWARHVCTLLGIEVYKFGGRVGEPDFFKFDCRLAGAKRPGTAEGVSGLVGWGWHCFARKGAKRPRAQRKAGSSSFLGDLGLLASLRAEMFRDCHWEV